MQLMGLKSAQHALKKVFVGWPFESHPLENEDRLGPNKLFCVYAEHSVLQAA